MRLITIPLLVSLLASFGCSHRLPAIKAEAVHQTTSFPGFASTVDATGINITDANIRAEDVSWRLSVLGFSSVTTAKGYQQRRERDVETK